MTSWGKRLGFYSDRDCPECGRHRLEPYENGKEICEKCGWCPQEERYVSFEEIYMPDDNDYGLSEVN